MKPAPGIIPELIKARKKITFDFGSENNTNWAKFFTRCFFCLWYNIPVSALYYKYIWKWAVYWFYRKSAYNHKRRADLLGNTFVKSGAANTIKALRPLTRTLNFAGYATNNIFWR